MRLFEKDYRMRASDDVLGKSNAVFQSVDLRLDAVETIAREFRDGNRLDVDALLERFSSGVSVELAALEQLRGEFDTGFTPERIQTTIYQRFTSDAEIASVLAELREGDDALSARLDTKANAASLGAHTSDAGNPHEVTAAQVGAYTEDAVDDLFGAEATIRANADQALSDGILARIPVYKLGDALPPTNIGPIWHAAYGSIMTWQVFNANGAAYSGYSSLDVGLVRPDTQPTPRTGWIKSNGGLVLKSDFPALWAWGQHHGLVVDLGSWVPGVLNFADNGDGNFKLFDLRAETIRFADDGRGIDAGRVHGSFQMDAGQGHHHYIRGLAGLTAASSAYPGYDDVSTRDGVLVENHVLGPSSDGVNGEPRTAKETRSRNVALAAVIKF